MDDRFTGASGQVGERTTCFIGSIIDTPGEGLIVLRGELGAAAVDRLREHIDAFLAGTTRHLVLDARAVRGVDPALPDLLADTQRRLAVRRGMLQVRGLPPSCQAPARTGPDARPGTTVPVPVPVPVPAVPVEVGAEAPRETARCGRHRLADAGAVGTPL